MFRHLTANRVGGPPTDRRRGASTSFASYTTPYAPRPITATNSSRPSSILRTSSARVHRGPPDDAPVADQVLRVVRMRDRRRRGHNVERGSSVERAEMARASEIEARRTEARVSVRRASKRAWGAGRSGAESVVKTSRGGISANRERKGKPTAEDGSTDEEAAEDERVGTRTRGLDAVAAARVNAPVPTEMRVSPRTLAGPDTHESVW